MAATFLRLNRNFARLGLLIAAKGERVTLCQQKYFHLQCKMLESLKIYMPSLSPTMTEGTIVKWHKKEGDSVSPGDVLCDIQTDKAVVSMDVEEEGILAKIILPENSKDVPIGKLIALMVEEGNDWKNVEIPAEEASVSAAPVAPVAPTPTPTLAVQSQTGSDETSVWPSVRKLLEEYQISPIDVPPSGPHGHLLKGDVLQFIKSRNLQKVQLPELSPPVSTSPVAIPPAAAAAAPMGGERYVDIEHTSMRKTIAKRLTLSKTTIPHSYATIESDVGAVTRLRKQLTGDDIKVSVNDFIIKAVAIALQRVPQINSVWEGEIPQQSSTVDIAVAVATANGLITPIVKNAAHLGVDEISSTVKDLANRAREGKLQLYEFQGGSFSISNLGMFGISEFSAVINPPQAAILAIGTSRLVVDSDGHPRNMMTVTLSYDGRIIDGTEASQFLEVFREVIQNPQFMIVGSRLSTYTTSL